MQQTHTLRKISCFAGGLLALSIASIGMRAQTLPAMPPTNQPGQVAPAPADSTTAAANPPLHADVLYTNGQLQVRADNSSLNQILRSISHVTGLKITGGVEEQRVFGSYGPAPLSTILATLLDGTGSNILLLGGNAGTPPELVLTSRSGGAMPPGPNSPAYAMYDDSNDRGTHVPPPSSPAPGTLTQTTPGSTTVAPTVATPPTSAPAASTLPVARAPGQPLTPEMVEQELLQMQAQQDQKKKELDDKIQQQQVDQRKRLNAVKPQNHSNQPPAGSNSPQ
jgi:hypothetical protein